MLGWLRPRRALAIAQRHEQRSDVLAVPGGTAPRLARALRSQLRASQIERDGDRLVGLDQHRAARVHALGRQLGDRVAARVDPPPQKRIAADHALDRAIGHASDVLGEAAGGRRRGSRGLVGWDLSRGTIGHMEVRVTYGSCRCDRALRPSGSDATLVCPRPGPPSPYCSTVRGALGLPALLAVAFRAWPLASKLASRPPHGTRAAILHGPKPSASRKHEAVRGAGRRGQRRSTRRQPRLARTDLASGSWPATTGKSCWAGVSRRLRSVRPVRSAAARTPARRSLLGAAG